MRFFTRVPLVLVLALFMGLALPYGVLAQTNDEVNAAIQFNFASPGARSLSLGGAFIGLADDATAAFTNPAGLVQISTPEVSAEGRHWSYQHVFADRGHFGGEPSGIGVDTVAGVQTGEESDDVVGLSFLSAVFPRERWAVAVYRHQVANFEAAFETQGVFTTPEPGVVGRIFPIRTEMDLRIVNFGLSGAYELTDGLSLGVGISYYDLSLDSRTERFRFLPGVIGIAPGQFFGPADLDAQPLVNFQTQHSDDGVVAGNVGFLLHPEGSKWQIGGVYRQGPEFDFEARNLTADGTAFVDETATFKVPDVYGLGLAYQITPAWKLTLDYNRVQYSDVTEDFVSLFPNVTDVENYVIDDGNELHLGLEYRFSRTPVPVRVRIGGWQEPEHQLQYQGDNLSERALFSYGDDNEHGTLGVGAVFLGNRLELNAAADFSKRSDVIALSVVWRFIDR